MTELLTILDQDGKAQKGKDPNLPGPELQQLYRLMVRTRALDDRGLALQRQGRIGFYVPSTGEEAAQIGTGACIGKSDWVYPSYRTPGLLMQCGAPLDQMIANCFGNSDDLCKGRQMPVHYAFGKQHLVSISSPIGTHVIQAAGTAMAQRLKGDKGLTWALFGDGGTSSNDFAYGE